MRSIDDDNLEMLRIIAVSVIALAVVVAAVIHLHVRDGHTDGVRVLRIITRRLGHHLDPVAGSSQVSADPSHGHDRSRESVNGAHHGEVLANVTNDSCLSWAFNVRLVLNVNRPVKKEPLQLPRFKVIKIKWVIDEPELFYCHCQKLP